MHRVPQRRARRQATTAAPGADRPSSYEGDDGRHGRHRRAAGLAERPQGQVRPVPHAADELQPRRRASWAPTTRSGSSSRRSPSEAPSRSAADRRPWCPTRCQPGRAPRLPQAGRHAVLGLRTCHNNYQASLPGQPPGAPCRRRPDDAERHHGDKALPRPHRPGRLTHQGRQTARPKRSVSATPTAAHERALAIAQTGRSSQLAFQKAFTNQQYVERKAAGASTTGTTARTSTPARQGRWIRPSP